jgi:hypothetical protein
MYTIDSKARDVFEDMKYYGKLPESANSPADLKGKDKVKYQTEL